MAANYGRLRLVSRICWEIVLLVSLVSALEIAALAKRMAPIHRGTSHRFWECACGVDLSPEGKNTRVGDVYFVDNNWAAYDEFHMHGSNIYFLPVSEVEADFPAVIEALQQKHEQGRDFYTVKGYLKWRDYSPRSGNDLEIPRTAQGLVHCVQREYLELCLTHGVEFVEIHAWNQMIFAMRWQRADWYWASIIFEWAFLSALTLFALWPGIRVQSILRWSIHIAFVPFLFLLPLYLGYASMSLTSAGPSGGVLYPFLLRWCRGGSMSDDDMFILRFTPLILEPLSAPIGSPAALTGLGMPGPSSAIGFGLLCAGSLLAIRYGLPWYCRYRKRFARRAVDAKTS